MLKAQTTIAILEANSIKPILVTLSVQRGSKVLDFLMLTPQTTQESGQEQTQNRNPETQQDASGYHIMASVAELLVALRNENQNNKYKTEKQQYTKMDFIDKKTGEVTSQRVLF